jgi:hypothetical protein
VQCSRFARVLKRHCHSLNGLGGQHGEEEKVEDEVSGKKGREENKASEEEVGSRLFTVFDFALTSMTASYGPAVVG